MNCRLPIFKLVTLAVCLAPCSAPAAESQSLTGQQLVRQAARNLALQSSLEAKLRQRVTLFDQYLVGSGSYRQLIIGDQKMFRLELVLQMADTTGSLLQVCNGDVLWEKRNLGETQSLGYATVQNIRDATSRAGGGPFDPTQLAIGGLDQLLRGLDDSFEFGEPAPQQIQELPVWEIRGKWKRDKVAAILPVASARSADQDAALPDHVPQRVTVVLGRDRRLPLFPYRIVYERRVAAPTGKANENPVDATAVTNSDHLYRPIVTLELFEVQRYASMQQQHFSFQRPRTGTKPDDLTGQILERLRATEQDTPRR